MTTHQNNPIVPGRQDLSHLHAGIERTRNDMSSTLDALEQKLNPADLREKAAAELVIVEQHVKAAVKEQLVEVHGMLKEEMRDAKVSLEALMMVTKDTVIRDAKVAVEDVMVNAKDTIIFDAKEAAEAIIVKAKEAVKEDVLAVKESVKRDLHDAYTNAKTTARAATFGKLEDYATKAGDVMNSARDSLVDTVRKNPIPAALAGVGLVWLLMNRSSSASRSGITTREKDPYTPGTFPPGKGTTPYAPDAAGAMAHASDSVKELAHDAQHKVSSMAHDAKDAAGAALHKISDTAKSGASAASEKVSHFADSAAKLGGRVAHGASDMAHHAGDSVSHFAHEIPKQAMRAEKQAERTYFEHPIAVGAAVLAVGAVVGLSIPRSNREDKLLGATRDRFFEGAEGMAKDAAERIRHLGQDAAAAVLPASSTPAAQPS